MKLSTIRAALADLQLTPSKTLGQNFLHDQNLARWIVAQLAAAPGDALLEIGPGLGALTGAALETGASLLALEKDKRLADFLQTRFAHEPRFRVECTDALDFDPRTLWPQRPVKVFGNLPYYVSTPLLFHFLSPAVPVTRGVFSPPARTGRTHRRGGTRVQGLRYPERGHRASLAGETAPHPPGQCFLARTEGGQRLDRPDPARTR